MGNSSSRYDGMYPNYNPGYVPAVPAMGPYKESGGWNPFKRNKRKKREQAMRDYWYTTPMLFQYPGAVGLPYGQQPFPQAQTAIPVNQPAAEATRMPVPQPAQYPIGASQFPLGASLANPAVYPSFAEQSMHMPPSFPHRSRRHRRPRSPSVSSSASSGSSSSYTDPSSYETHHHQHQRQHQRRRHPSYGHHHPLPRPPKDVLASTPYRAILNELPSVQREAWRSRYPDAQPEYRRERSSRRRKDGFFRPLRRQERYDPSTLAGAAASLAQPFMGVGMPQPEPGMPQPGGGMLQATMNMPQPDTRQSGPPQGAQMTMLSPRMQHSSTPMPMPMPGGSMPMPNGPMRMPTPAVVPRSTTPMPGGQSNLIPPVMPMPSPGGGPGPYVGFASVPGIVPNVVPGQGNGMPGPSMPTPGGMPMPAPGMPMPTPGMSMPMPGMSMPPPPGVVPMPSPSMMSKSMVPPIRFSGYGQYAGFLHHSEHKVLYDEELYPTALHLYEALKFLAHRPDVAKRIRQCADPEEVYEISTGEAADTRPDWQAVAIQTMDTVLYQKFRQHGDLRALLLDTTPADLIYAEKDDNFWGDGPNGMGSNELGKALMRVRERLRVEAGMA